MNYVFSFNIFCKQDNLCWTFVSFKQPPSRHMDFELPHDVIFTCAKRDEPPSRRMPIRSFSFKVFVLPITSSELWLTSARHFCFVCFVVKKICVICVICGFSKQCISKRSSENLFHIRSFHKTDCCRPSYMSLPTLSSCGSAV